MTDPEGLLADYEARMAETIHRAEQVRAGLAAVTATARSADGKVAVTVNASGNVVGLTLPDSDLASTLLATIRRAQGQLADAVRTIMPADLAGTALMAELDTQYRTTYPQPEPARAPRRLMRLGAEEEREAERPHRSAPGDDRTLLR